MVYFIIMSNALEKPFNPLTISTLFPDDQQYDQYVAELLRNQVNQIVGSYHHHFDQLYESVQNAVDACEKALSHYKAADQDYLPEVQVIVNFLENEVTVLDNGIGMSRDDVIKYFFTPNATLKAEPQASGERQRGEKGVGATFAAYGTNHIHVTTKQLGSGEITSCSLKLGLDWVNRKTKLSPMPEVEPDDPHTELEYLSHGTAVTIRFSEDTNIGILSEYGNTLDQWEVILRLHTALGLVNLGNSDTLADVLTGKLRLINEDNEEKSRRIAVGYYFPHDTTKSRIRLSSLTRSTKNQLPDSQRDMNILYDTFSDEQVRERVQTRMENMRYLRDKTRERISRILSEHNPKAYVAFTYGSEFWEEANRKYWPDGMDGMFGHGIVFATKGQKIGEQKKIDFKFRSGDFNRFFILLDMENLRSDIGRKSFRRDIEEFAQFFANAIQSVFNDNDDCLRPSPGPFAESQEAELEEIKDRALALPNLDIDGLGFIKEPREEQDVIALFFNLLGANRLRGFRFYSTHISRKYDGVGTFELDELEENIYNETENRLGIAKDHFNRGTVKSPKKNFIEFKYNTDALVGDIRSGRKRLQDIKWLICWEVGDKHVGEGIGITEILGPAHVNKRDYYGVTHIMTEGQDKVYVICLKTVIQILASQEHVGKRMT